MKTIYKYIYFVKIEDKTKTSVWSCKNNNSNFELGIIKWYSSWRQYCFFPSENTIFNRGCLEDINNFINQIMDERKNNG